jgi:hypothetical protein
LAGLSRELQLEAYGFDGIDGGAHDNRRRDNNRYGRIDAGCCGIDGHGAGAGAVCRAGRRKSAGLNGAR